MHSRTNFELIETLWNVNYSSANSFAVVVLELIETLWNVNHANLRHIVRTDTPN